MSDLNVVAVIEARPESIEEVRAALLELATASREEEGCVAYTLNESITSPGTFVVVETWRSAADLELHSQTPHMAAALGKVGELLAGAPAIHPLTPVG